MLLDSLHGKQNPQIKCRAWDLQILPRRFKSEEKMQRSGSTFPELNVCIPRLGSSTEPSVEQECPYTKAKGTLEWAKNWQSSDSKLLNV